MTGGIFDPVLHSLPLWAVAILMVALFLSAREIGIRLYRKYGAKRPREPASDANDYIIGAIFGLLAFMMGFTFSIAIDRFDTRRGIVSEEANAIRSTYLTASMLNEPHAARIQDAVRQYAHSRIAPDGIWKAENDGMLNRSRQLRLRVWTEARAGALPIRDTDLGTYLVESANETMNIGARRELVARSHIPTRILDVLMLYTLVSSGVLGFLIGDERRGLRQASSLLLILYSVAFILIIDLDRPQAGTVKVPQTALEELIKSLDADAAAAGKLTRPVPAAPPG